MSEVQSLSYDEWSSWRTFYQIEPWGFHDQEYRTASMLAMMANVNMSKKSRPKKVSDFIRNMPKLLERAYQGIKDQIALKEKYQNATIRERRQMIANSLGLDPKIKRKVKR